MSTTIANQTPYLITTRNFPEDLKGLTVEMGRTYIDIANSVNQRTVGVFSNTHQVITGESWFTRGGNQKQQALRRVYPFVAADLPNIPHQITISQISGFIRIWGTFVDAGGIWYPLPFVSATAAANQVQVLVNSTNIVVTVGGGAPAPVRGFVILEWLSNV